jgi:hypothetical protein
MDVQPLREPNWMRLHKKFGKTSESSAEQMVGPAGFEPAISSA